MKWRTLILLAFAAVLAAGGWILWQSRPKPILVVATWAGAYGRAQASAMFRPYSDAARTDVRIAQYDGGIDGLRQQVTTRHYTWDLVDLELPDAIAACGAHLLDAIDTKSLPAGLNDLPPQSDFVDGALTPCWVGSVVYAQVIAFAPKDYEGEKPKTAQDFFDVKRFPGTRGLRRASPKFNLELALLADGVKPVDVYATLQTQDGVKRALAKLDTIRPFVVWWNAGGEPIQMLDNSTVAMTTALNGDIYDAAAHHHALGIIWDRQLYELEVFGIPRGNPNKDRAMDFLRFATRAEQLAHVAQWVPYGPTRHSALSLVGKNPELHIAMRPFLPTAPENFATAFRVDDAWWSAHGAEMDAAWQQWLATKPPRIR
jgi:putative spermidine/putrescine transport system substrate-binding protein